MTPDAAKDASLATQSEMDLSTIQDLSVGETPVQEASERPAFQMVPGPADGALSCRDPKESLPSIVVEPTDLSAQESGEYCWPPKGTASLEEEDIFQEQQTSPSHLTDWQGEGEEQEGAGNEEGSPNKGGVQRRQSNPLATAQLSCSRLTPPLCPNVQRRCPLASGAEPDTGHPGSIRKLHPSLFPNPPSHARESMDGQKQDG